MCSMSLPNARPPPNPRDMPQASTVKDQSVCPISGEQVNSISNLRATRKGVCEKVFRRLPFPSLDCPRMPEFPDFPELPARLSPAFLKLPARIPPPSSPSTRPRAASPPPPPHAAASTPRCLAIIGDISRKTRSRESSVQTPGSRGPLPPGVKGFYPRG